MENKELKCREFYVEGMHCAACELLIEKKLSKINGVKKVDANLSKGKVYIESESDLNADDLSYLVEKNGYRILENKTEIKNKKNSELPLAGLIALIIVLGFIALQKSGFINLINSSETTYPVIFFIGIVASLSSCMAVVGGLVLSISSNYAKGNKFKPLIAFHLSRLISFFLLGGLIGLLGSAFILTPTITFILNIILFLVMLIMGLNLLDVFPQFRKFQVKTPKFLGKKVLGIEGSDNALAPILLGIATFVLPCGFTQSMQIYSLTTGNFLSGALTMFVFALGTFPVLALISFASVKLSKTLQSGVFFKTAGLIILFFALFNFIAAMVAVGLIDPVFNI